MCHVGTPKRAVLAVYGASLPDPPFTSTPGEFKALSAHDIPKSACHKDARLTTVKTSNSRQTVASDHIHRFTGRSYRYQSAYDQRSENHKREENRRLPTP